MKDVLAFLRILENPSDEVSWYRLLLLLPGIGESTPRATMLADLNQLQHIAAGYPDRATFLSALALEPPQATQDLAGPGGSGLT